MCLPHTCHWLSRTDGHLCGDQVITVGTRRGLIPVLEVFYLPAPYRPFNTVFQGQLSGDDFTNSSTPQSQEQSVRTVAALQILHEPNAPCRSFIVKSPDVIQTNITSAMQYAQAMAQQHKRATALEQ